MSNMFGYNRRSQTLGASLKSNLSGAKRRR